MFLLVSKLQNDRNAIELFANVWKNDIRNWNVWSDDIRNSREKPLGAWERTINKLDPHVISTPGLEPRSRWWEASALTNAPGVGALYRKDFEGSLKFIDESFELIPQAINVPFLAGRGYGYRAGVARRQKNLGEAVRRALKREKMLGKLAGCTLNVQPANLHK